MQAGKIVTQKVTDYILIGFCLTLSVLILAVSSIIYQTPEETTASSHREAPLISQDPFADTTDVYAFVSPDNPDTVTLIANWIPFEAPDGGPNYYRFADDVLYEIHVDNNGDAVPDFSYQFQFTTTGLNSTETFLYNRGAVTTADDSDLTIKQTFMVTEVTINGATSLGASLAVPPINIGDKSSPDYDTNFDNDTIVHNLSDGAGKVFAGPRDDPFFVDFSVFDLLTLRGQASPIGYESGVTKGIDGLAGYNVHSIALQIPISRLVAGDDPVIGVWATSSRRSMRTLSALGSVQQQGHWVQISRLGMPLVNEAVLPLALKDVFNGLKPEQDVAVYTNQGNLDPTFLLQNRVENPELGQLLCGLYGVPMPGPAANCNTPVTDGTPRSGRGDIFDIFLQGMVLANPFTITTHSGATQLPAGFNVNRPTQVTPADMLRLNTAIKGDACSSTPSRLGVLGGDACGFPNGRRLADDVVEIEILAVAGAAYEVLDDRDTDFSFNAAFLSVLTDSIDENDKAFMTEFPYLASPHQGQTRVHDSLSCPNQHYGTCLPIIQNN